MIDTLSFYNELKKYDLSFFSGVPDSLLANLCACISDKTPTENNIIAANEGNAIAICAGYHISTGKIGVAYMQNSGIGNAVNPLLSLIDEKVYSIPVLLIVGWRGEPGTKDEPQHIKQGMVTCELFETMKINYTILNDDYMGCLKTAIKEMKEGKPYALIVRKDMFTEYPFKKQYSNYKMTREEALDIILSNISEEDVVISTTGKTSREVFELRESNKQDHSNDFLTVGSMGHTSSIAYGITIGTKTNVYCIDGDGSFIMHMGSLAVIATRSPHNFKYIINDNNSHESVGGQPTCSYLLNISQILEGFGFKKIFVADNKIDLNKAIKEMKTDGMCALILKTQQGSRKNLGRPTITPIENKKMLMKKIRGVNVSNDDSDDKCQLSPNNNNGIIEREKKLVYVPMSADIIHPGHINILKEANKMGDVMVGLFSDDAIRTYKPEPYMNYEQRKIVVESIKYVTYVVKQETKDYSDNLMHYKPNYMVHGKDWREGPLSEVRQKAIDLMAMWGGTVIEPDYTEGISSSKLKEKVASYKTKRSEK